MEGNVQCKAKLKHELFTIYMYNMVNAFSSLITFGSCNFEIMISPPESDLKLS